MGRLCLSILGATFPEGQTRSFFLLSNFQDYFARDCRPVSIFGGKPFFDTDIAGFFVKKGLISRSESDIVLQLKLLCRTG